MQTPLMRFVRIERRLGQMQASLCAGFDATMPGGTFYLYVKAPVGAGDVDFSNAEEAALYLIEEFGISTVPWDNTGAYLRFGAVFESKNEEDDQRVLSLLENRLSKAALRF